MIPLHDLKITQQDKGVTGRVVYITGCNYGIPFEYNWLHERPDVVAAMFIGALERLKESSKRTVA